MGVEGAGAGDGDADGPGRSERGVWSGGVIVGSQGRGWKGGFVSRLLRFAGLQSFAMSVVIVVPS